ncbi:signal peptidase I [Treponema sp.]|uniref:signal peptidase I n=1 Tax=Treponema sp. TaxID=166 RepID=UPI00298D912D|nr:signal peptidase I [Treponema sp.]MCQ2240612.1 signal peptidase I [Treponema sp.]
MKQNVADYSFEYKKKKQKVIQHGVILVVSVILSLTLFLNFILFAVYTNSSSMETDISKDGVSLVCPMLKNPSRGQVVYLSPMDEETLPFYKEAVNLIVNFFALQKYKPFGNNTRMTGKHSIRRVVALPGDSYYMKDYVLYVKPAGESFYLTEFELASKPYNIRIYSVPVEWDGMGCAGTLAETTLGNDEYFVLADNRIEGIDSRVYGGIKSNRIEGRLIWQVFPFNKMKLF